MLELARSLQGARRMDTLAFVLAAMNVVVPDADHSELGGAIARVVEAQPFTRDDESRRRVASLVVAIAFREGALRTVVLGDHDKSGKPHSFCTMQIHDRSGGTPALNDDLDLCIGTGLRMLRTSMQMCPAHPVAFYAEGHGGCTSTRGQRISADRIGLANWIAFCAARALQTRPNVPRDVAPSVAISPRDAASEALRHDRPVFARVRAAADVVGMR